jgi:uncharacterized protein
MTGDTHEGRNSQAGGDPGDTGLQPSHLVKERTDPRALDLLVCPLTKTMLEYDEARQELISRRANLAYPIRSGVPLLTREAARNLDTPAK